MTRSRLYWDCTDGQPFPSQYAEISQNTYQTGFSTGQSRHFEARRQQQQRELALHVLKEAWGTEHVFAVFHLGNAFRIIRERLGMCDVSSLSRRGMREILGGEIIGVAPDGTHSFPHHLDRFGFQYVNHEIGLRCDVNEIQSFAGTLIVDASETIGREHYKPEHITIARASAWAGPANSCFIIDPRNQLGLDEKHFIPLQLDSMLLNFAVVSWEINVDSINRRYEINQNNLDLLIEGLTQFPDITVHTPRAFQQRASHLLSFSIKECDSEYAAELYDSYGIAIGSQSACMANSGQPSEVLQALGIETAGHLRLSLPLETTTLEVERFLETTTEVLEKVKQERRFSAE